MTDHVTDHSDRQQIDLIIARFFGEFDNRSGRRPSLEPLSALFCEGAIVIRDTGNGDCHSYSVLEFAEPRIRLGSGAGISLCGMPIGRIAVERGRLRSPVPSAQG